ncbi:hypothetical protein Hanom_Chr08g00722171 [Helianthus anomalus]
MLVPTSSFTYVTPTLDGSEHLGVTCVSSKSLILMLICESLLTTVSSLFLLSLATSPFWSICFRFDSVFITVSSEQLAVSFDPIPHPPDAFEPMFLLSDFISQSRTFTAFLFKFLELPKIPGSMPLNNGKLCLLLSGFFIDLVTRLLGTPKHFDGVDESTGFISRLGSSLYSAVVGDLSVICTCLKK